MSTANSGSWPQCRCGRLADVEQVSYAPGTSAFLGARPVITEWLETPTGWLCHECRQVDYTRISDRPPHVRRAEIKAQRLALIAAFRNAPKQDFQALADLLEALEALEPY